MLDYSHNVWLVAASLAVALMAGFTGLYLTHGASRLDTQRRKLVVALAAVILGGGIWSMHFVAMLGLQLPILFYYDALITLISALVAILMVGLALLLLHFRPRTPQTMIGSGMIVGLGIVLMHYIGMAGMQLCRPVYNVLDVFVATLASVILSVAAIWVAYGNRTQRNILLGTVCFGLAVFTMHFVATGLTDFVASDSVGGAGPALDNQVLAMGVTVSVFLICGAFLLTGISFIEPTETPKPEPASEPAAFRAGVPFEREGQTFFTEPAKIAAIRAEGHYSVLYMGAEKLFCPWSITEAETRLKPDGFLRAHRSYLVNPKHVSGFERHKDNGTCYFDGVDALTKVPVSRSRLTDIREALGL
ncbi:MULTISPECIES: MHYT domain-containing protein [unclassified Ruegeria]|uniref:MHYT domain-containing protein n=1 Tax=unclassified Ruegeria TaxID=2625375 RepID=UPI0014896046|nr:MULTISPECIES: MHYT domain-containing protein [unclassified Ruegeria]NOD36120.1 carbon monoxide dehydrogenase [Ruegeria sp. HKCCD7296]NOD45735.1 carbon monoxide dehydrogenase [Ruegeria sp. HKCCD5849]NOD50965.1 carbon monoxide dehydrogenase [Ruegeria sp. HKCCD5851]NOD67772.1 carbon monoxide dehydrogenase [Ruegeria sp. HKCCD7303]NOE43513.1 carbon monoxide dehydrogenase [Ruegeria sp. HKCCD7319]